MKNKKYKQYISEQETKSDRGSVELKKLLTAKNISGLDVIKRLTEFGIKKSEPTIYNWINNPYSMNLYELGALSHVLGLKINELTTIISGEVLVMVPAVNIIKMAE